jgi:hypothetical protein
MTSRMQTLIVLGVFMLLYVFVAGMGRITLVVPLIFIPLVLFLLARRDLLFVILCFLYYSTLRIPMMEGQLELYHAAVFLYIVAALGACAVGRRSIHITAPVFFAICFGLVIAYTMKFRGTGFRLLGSGLWGGGRYVEILLGLGIFLVADTIRLSLRRWRTALVGMVLAGALPALAEILYVYTKGAAGFLYYVLQPIGLIGAAMQRMESGRMVRFTMMLQVSHIYMIPFFLRRLGRRLRPRQLFFPVLAMVLGGFSGHRMVLLNVTLYIWVYLFLLSRRRIAYLLVSAVLASSVLFILGQLAFVFPSSIQRMLSIIPFSNASSDVMTEAGSTITWRILLWKDTLAEIPKYLWLGKGFAYSIELESARDVRLWANYAIWWAKVQSAYHQGFLSLLVGLGLPGLLAGCAFLFSLCARHYRFWRDHRLDPEFAPVHYAVLVLLLVETMVYFLVYGDVFVSFPYLCFLGAIAEGLYRSGTLENKEDEHAAVSPI